MMISRSALLIIMQHLDYHIPEYVNTSAIVKAIIIAGISFSIMNHLMMALTMLGHVVIEMLDDDK